MPVVPFVQNPQAPQGQPFEPPPEEFTLMAAAQMHQEGRLIKVMDLSNAPLYPKNTVIKDLRDPTQIDINEIKLGDIKQSNKNTENLSEEDKTRLRAKFEKDTP